MSNFTNLTTQLVAVVNAVQQNGNPAFAEVVQWPTINFSGTPSCTIVPSDNESDYATIVQDLRTYVFYVDIYESIENLGYQTAFLNMMVLVDTVLDAVDNSNDLNGSAQMVRPTPSSWSVVQSDMGVLLNARVTVRVALTVDTNNG